MKCDELKVYVPQDGSYGLEPEEGGKLVEEETCYLKSDVDAAIAELKQKLQDQCISCPVKMQEDDVVAEKDNEMGCLHVRYNRLAHQGRIQMSELKADNTFVFGEECLAYKKSDADKVIAELKADYKEACDRLQTANLIKDEQLAVTRHNKYKRCLAMASYWVAVSYQCVDDKHRQRAKKHHYKWLELAEQFKEAK